jgi:hypothetical protein
MHRSGHMVAAFDTLSKITDRFTKNLRGRWNDNFTKKQMSDFLSNTCMGYLYSYGEDFPNRKRLDKYNASRYRIFRKARETRLFDNANFIADSGGFQISIGKLTKKESETLVHLYYDFLREYHHILQYAFILDVPPGNNCQVFDSFDDVYRMNLESYLTARSFPDELRKKIIYIHHFRTPKLWDIYTRILRENEMFPMFDYFGTGGVVANLQGDLLIPCIIYILPLIPLLNECKKYGRKEMKFHILGGASYRDMFFYELFSRCIEKAHGIKVKFTYDSTALFKQVMSARYLHVEDNVGNIIKMEFKSHQVDLRFYDGMTVSDTVQRAVDHLADSIGIKRISVDGLYDPALGTLHDDIRVYTMMYILLKFSDVEVMLKDFVDRIYPLYESGDHDLFYEQAFPMMVKLNQGKLTKKQTIKTGSIVHSLDMLKSLDEDECKYVVNKYLSKDEFTTLLKRGRVLTV